MKPRATIFLFAFTILGCATQQPAHPAASLSPTLDGCADHLQEICGIILQYYVDNRQLPATIEQLQSLAARQNEPGDLFICPVSRLRYIYNPAGIPLPDLSPPARLVMYDAEPVHNNHRRGIAISASAGHQPLICRVVLVPNSISLNPPTTQPAG